MKTTVTIEVELDLADAMDQQGIKELSDHELSLFEYFVEVQLEQYNPAQIIERLELEPDSKLAKIFREGFDISAKRS